MNNLKVISSILLCSFLLFFSINSVNSKPHQNCSVGYIKQINLNVNSKRTNIRGALPFFENCVLGIKNNVNREEYITNAYANLGSHYQSIGNNKRAREYRSAIARENMK